MNIICFGKSYLMLSGILAKISIFLFRTVWIDWPCIIWGLTMKFFKNKPPSMCVYFSIKNRSTVSHSGPCKTSNALHEGPDNRFSIYSRVGKHQVSFSFWIFDLREWSSNFTAKRAEHTHKSLLEYISQKVKPYSENLRKGNRKFDIDRIEPFGRFQCKLEFKQTRNICNIVQ